MAGSVELEDRDSWGNPVSQAGIPLALGPQGSLGSWTLSREPCSVRALL